MNDTTLRLHKLDIGTVIDLEAPRPLWTEHFVTSRGHGPSCSLADANALFATTARCLAEDRIAPMQDKVYGTAAARQSLLAARRGAWMAAGLDPELPVTYIEYQLLGDDVFAGQQVWGLAPRSGADVTLETVDAAEQRGRLLRAPGLRALILQAIDGLPATSEVDQAAAMFRRASAALATVDLRYRDTIRTWLYFDRLLDWYDDFNAVRSAHHKLEAVPDIGMPASTGIQGSAGTRACFMDLLALQVADSGPLQVQLIRRTARQDGAYTYGSAFSRGMYWQAGAGRTVFVSGTASIDAAGNSVYIGDAEAQAVETLLAVAGVLAEAGAKLSQITMATVFCKTVQAWEAFEEVMNLLGIDRFPHISVIGDVCRDDLLIEIEAMAACASPADASDEGLS